MCGTTEPKSVPCKLAVHAGSTPPRRAAAVLPHRKVTGLHLFSQLLRSLHHQASRSAALVRRQHQDLAQLEADACWVVIVAVQRGIPQHFHAVGSPLHRRKQLPIWVLSINRGGGIYEEEDEGLQPSMQRLRVRQQGAWQRKSATSKQPAW
jgi:hypothetical protein